jgi:hypothetical protein
MDMYCAACLYMQHKQRYGQVWTWAYSMDTNMQKGHDMQKICTRTCSMDVDSSMDMDIQHGLGHNAWTRTCSMDMDVHHGLEHAPWTWTCTMDMDIHQGNGHAPGKWACTREIDMYCIMDMDMHHGHGHALWTWMSFMDTNMQGGHRHAANTWTCSMDMYIQNLHGPLYGNGLLLYCT